MSICGVSLLSVLIDLFLPDGQTNKHIKTIFSFAILLVMIAPLPKLLKNATNVSSFFTGDNYNIQEDFIYTINQSKIDVLKQKIEVSLSDNGMMNIKIDISANVFDKNLEINAIFVDIKEMIISKENTNINISDKIYNIISKIVNIKREQLIINE